MVVPGERSLASPLSTAAFWAVSLIALGVAGLLAAELVMMPVSLDVGEILLAGQEPWRDAAVAGALFFGLAAIVAVSLRVWHGRRRALACALLAAEVAVVGWACVVVYRDYF